MVFQSFSGKLDRPLDRFSGWLGVQRIEVANFDFLWLAEDPVIKVLSEEARRHFVIVEVDERVQLNFKQELDVIDSMTHWPLAQYYMIESWFL